MLSSLLWPSSSCTARSFLVRRQISVHYAAEYETAAIAVASGLVKPAKRAADMPAKRGNARTGAQRRGKSEPRRTH